MASQHDLTQALRLQMQHAYRHHTPVRIQGGGSKPCYGHSVTGELLDVSSHSGIIEYDAAELVLTARAGTPITLIDAVLAEHGQMLAFEPPHFATKATLGGTVACNVSGPRRPYAGAVRDAVLGCTVLDGRGQVLKFGGQVMKNVAGFDVSRLMAGALGTLGVLLDISIKVLPSAPCELTLAQPMDIEEAVLRMNQLAGQSWPLTAGAWVAGELYLRFSSTQAATDHVANVLTGRTISNEFWAQLKEQQLDFFQQARTLWRLSLPPTAKQPDLPGSWLIDWGGAQRWLASNAAEDVVRQQTTQLGGHAMLYRSDTSPLEVFQPLHPPLFALHRGLKQVFDPAGILNPGRMYRGL